MVYIYGGKNTQGNHLSDVWSLDLKKLAKYQNIKLVDDNKDDTMKYACNIQKTVKNLNKNNIVTFGKQKSIDELKEKKIKADP